MISFVINDRLFPLLQTFGLPFDNTKMLFRFDEVEDLPLKEQWAITRDALLYFDLDADEIKKTFHLPVTGVKKRQDVPVAGGLAANFQ
jgi:hypothetical protein